MEICLVEDNPGDILLIQTTLEEKEKLDAEFIIKTNGMDASKYINQSEKIPDLVILDLNLPYRNGFELFSEMKTNARFKNVPVVFFTSSASQYDKSKALSMGAKAYMIKSIDLEEYKKQVLSFLDFVPR